jgi:hypothetical protein
MTDLEVAGVRRRLLQGLFEQQEPFGLGHQILHDDLRRQTDRKHREASKRETAVEPRGCEEALNALRDSGKEGGSATPDK